MARWGSRFSLVAIALCALPLVPAHALSLTEPEQAVLRLIREERIPRGLDPLSVASDLVGVARRHSARMAAERRIFHNPGLGSEVDDWIRVTENVGRGPRIADIHDAFMDSDAHRPHIVDPRMEELGVGVVEGDDGLFYVTQIFALREHDVSPEPAPRTATVRRAAPARRVASPPPAPVRRRARALPAVRTVEVLRYLVALDEG